MLDDRDFVNYEQAERFKKRGFDWNTPFYYIRGRRNFSLANHNWNTSEFYVSAPTLEQAVRWLREVEGLYVEVSLEAFGVEPDKHGGLPEITEEYGYYVYNFNTGQKIQYTTDPTSEFKYWTTHEEALSAGINRALTIAETMLERLIVENRDVLMRIKEKGD